MIVQKKGLEPSWYCYHTDLNRARLPIPPFLQNRYLFCTKGIVLSRHHKLRGDCGKMLKIWSFCDTIHGRMIFSY